MAPKLTRRQFLQQGGLAAAGLALASCRRPPAAQGTRPQVAIARAGTYEPSLIRRQVEAMLDGIGGLGDVVSAGDHVTLKVNLTGGLHFSPPAGFTAVESYLTHPEVVRALCELLNDAGAGKLTIVEAVFDDASYGAFGYQDAVQPVAAGLIDLNAPAPYTGFNATPVGPDAFIYETFDLNPILEETDVFVSVAKMKCHYECGVTHAMKNLVGLVPVTHYRQSADHWWRSGLHGHADEIKKRLPRASVDLNRARPIDLAIVDGIMTGEGGEVPRGSFRPVQPGVLLAGKNAVATDAVATAAMGFDPTADAPSEPFLRCDNHLNLADELGLGTNRLDEIDIVGEAVEDIAYQFEPSRSM